MSQYLKVQIQSYYHSFWPCLKAWNIFRRWTSVWFQGSRWRYKSRRRSRRWQRIRRSSGCRWVHRGLWTILFGRSCSFSRRRSRRLIRYHGAVKENEDCSYILRLFFDEKRLDNDCRVHLFFFNWMCLGFLLGSHISMLLLSS